MTQNLKILGATGLVGIGILLFLMIYYNQQSVETLAEQGISTLRKVLVTEYGPNKLKFFVEPIVPKQKMETIEVVKQIELENGTTITQTVTKEVPVTSGGIVSLQDKQTGIDQIVKRGHQALIEGQMELYDNDSNFVPPPYTMQFALTCEFREWCNSSSSIYISEKSDVNGGFRYIWATNSDWSLGEYIATMTTRSIEQVKRCTQTFDKAGNPVEVCNPSYEEYTAELRLVLIE